MNGLLLSWGLLYSVFKLIGHSHCSSQPTSTSSSTYKLHIRCKLNLVILLLLFSSSSGFFSCRCC